MAFGVIAGVCHVCACFVAALLVCDAVCRLACVAHCARDDDRYALHGQKERGKIIRDVASQVIYRNPRMCNFIEWKEKKIVYRRYASLYFMVCIDKNDNELVRDVAGREERRRRGSNTLTKTHGMSRLRWKQFIVIVLSWTCTLAVFASSTLFSTLNRRSCCSTSSLLPAKFKKQACAL